MDKKFEALIDNTLEKFCLAGVEVNGILVSDKNGLPLANKNVTISPGPIGLITTLATTLSGPQAIVCLENNENQVLLHQTEQAVVATYVKHTTSN